MGHALTGAAIVLALSTAGAALAAPAGAGPFAFTGARLGMSLQAWRSLPFPGKASPGVRAACSGDPGIGRNAGLEPTAAQRKAGEVVCGYIARYGRYVLAQGIRPAAKRKPVVVHYLFTGGRLTGIRYRTSRDAFDKVAGRLKAAYGPPDAVLRDQVQTELGKLDRVRMSWAAPSGSAVLTDPADARLDLVVELSSRGAKG
jgi:hypothetical protein